MGITKIRMAYMTTNKRVTGERSDVVQSPPRSAAETLLPDVVLPTQPVVQTIQSQDQEVSYVISTGDCLWLLSAVKLQMNLEWPSKLFRSSVRQRGSKLGTAGSHDIVLTFLRYS